MIAYRTSFIFVFRINQHVVCTKCTLRYGKKENEIYMLIEPLYS